MADILSQPQCVKSQQNNTDCELPLTLYVLIQENVVEIIKCKAVITVTLGEINSHNSSSQHSSISCMNNPSKSLKLAQELL